MDSLLVVEIILVGDEVC